jgi:hypothetical protein
MPGITGANSLDLLKGALARLQVGKWVTAGGSATLLDCGWLRNVDITMTRESKLVEVDNCTYAIDAYFQKASALLKATMVEASLRKLAMALGSDPTATTGDVVVLTTPGHTATWAIDEPSALQYWQVVLSVASQLMIPAHTEDPTAQYTTRTYTFWRGLMKANISQAFKRTDETVIPIEIDFLMDTSITYSKGVIGKIGKIVDSV